MTPVRCALGASALIALTLVGCSNDPLRQGPLFAVSHISATVDGSDWISVQTQAFRNGNEVTITGSDFSLLTVGLIFQDQGVGEYAIGPGEATSGSVVDPPESWLAGDFQGTGTVTVDEITSTRALGTFSFTATANEGSGPPATRVVTNGMFDVTF